MPEEPSRNFDSNFFLDKVNRWTEGPRLDFKQDYYNLKDKEQLAKFIKHIIAFSNIARRIGKECWIIFGVTDETKEIVDIREKFPGKEPSGWKNPIVDFSSKMTQGFTEEFRKCFDIWISPDTPDFDFDYGDVLDPTDNVNKFVTYITIRPMPTDSPFCLKKSFPDGKHQIGDTFIRKNSSTVLVLKKQEKYLLSRSKVEYFSRVDWKKLNDYHLTGNFQRYMDIKPFINPRIEGYEDRDDTIQIVINNMIQHKVQIIIGARGEGKSILLHRITHKLAKELSDPIADDNEFGQRTEVEINNNSIVKSIEKELEVETKGAVPLYYSLRTSFQSASEFEEKICKAICEILPKRNTPVSNLSALWNMPGTKWVFLLDGIDELRNKELAGQVLQNWLQHLPENVNVILTSRPLSVPDIENFTRITIKPLSVQQIEQIIETRINENAGFFDEFKFPDSSPLQNIKEWISKNQDISNLLMNFRALDYFVKYIIPSNKFIKSDADDLLPFVDPIIKLQNHILENEYKASELSFNVSEITFESNDISLEKQQKDLSVLTSDDIEILDEKEEFLIPEISIVLKNIIDSLEKDEINRMQVFNANTSQVARHTRNSLSRIAWNENWDSIKFNSDHYKKDMNWIDDCQLNWAENIGYIQHTPNYIFYQFFNDLLRSYFAAEFAFEHELKEEGVNSMVKEQKRKITNEQPIHELISILNELLIANGREKLNINLGG